MYRKILIKFLAGACIVVGTVFCGLGIDYGNIAIGILGAISLIFGWVGLLS